MTWWMDTAWDDEPDTQRSPQSEPGPFATISVEEYSRLKQCEAVLVEIVKAGKLVDPLVAEALDAVGEAIDPMTGLVRLTESYGGYDRD